MSSSLVISHSYGSHCPLMIGPQIGLSWSRPTPWIISHPGLMVSRDDGDIMEYHGISMHIIHVYIHKQLKTNMCPISVRLQMDGKHWQLEHALKCSMRMIHHQICYPTFRAPTYNTNLNAMNCNIYPQVQQSNRW